MILKHSLNKPVKNRVSLNDCKLISLPKIGDRNGQITSVNNSIEIPFEIKRIFYLYDIPAGEDRGAHAHIVCHQFLVAASGTFDVEVDDGSEKKRFSLNQPDVGLHIPPGLWAAELNFSSGSTCLVLASHPFDETDYLRDYAGFIKHISNE
ncbi:MAG: WxcM-like domain-containing protein [Ferruginibacter sp.]|nr:WxcM-like domain-containing protein [Ferruginibacter sp.]